MPVAPNSASAYRVLHATTPAISYVYPHDWSADGKQILAVIQNADKTNQIATVSARRWLHARDQESRLAFPLGTALFSRYAVYRV
jgi:hypothetical protein